MSKIGVFDSGVGGKSVAKAIKEALPNHTIIYKNDVKNMPYANKNPEELYKLVKPILLQLASEGCEIIVIACNTVSTTIYDKLKLDIKVPLLKVEPLVNIASKQSKTGVIAVFATPTTLGSPRYKKLKAVYAKGKKVLEPDCSDWSYMIETNLIDEQKIINTVKSVCELNADALVLGCTHYHWIEKLIKQTAGSGVKVIQPEKYIVAKLKKRLRS